jgi:hypothetical protein
VFRTHDSPLASYERLKNLSPEHHETLWGRQSFCHVFFRYAAGRKTSIDALMKDIDRVLAGRHLVRDVTRDA